jgi:hypothetical protein
MPLLAVAAGGGLLTSAAALFKPGSELVVGGLAFVGSLGAMAFLQRRRAREVAACGCAAASSTEALFESPEPSVEEPVACTADLRDKPTVQRQITGYRTAFTHLIATERFEGGFRWRFRAAPGLEAELHQLMAREHDCCRFFQFKLGRQGGELVWETRAKPHASSVLDEFSRMPQTLQAEPRPIYDVAALKSAVGAAGLRFADEVGSKTS